MSATTSRARWATAATGGDLAVPIFTEFMQDALKGKPPTPFNMPAGMTQVWIDPATGVKANAGETGDRRGVQARHRAQPRHLGDRRQFQRLQQHPGRQHRRRRRRRLQRRWRRRPAATGSSPNRHAGAASAASCSAAAACSERLRRLSRPAPDGSPRRCRDGVDAALRAIGERLLAAAPRRQGLWPRRRPYRGEVAPVVVVSGRSRAARSYQLLYNPRVVAVRRRTGERRGGLGVAARASASRSRARSGPRSPSWTNAAQPQTAPLRGLRRARRPARDRADAGHLLPRRAFPAEARAWRSRRREKLAG